MANLLDSHVLQNHILHYKKNNQLGYNLEWEKSYSSNLFGVGLTAHSNSTGPWH